MPVEFRQHQLENGLTIIAEPNPSAHTSAIGFFVNTGTRDEDKPLMGVSHFLEHMMFKGTDRRSADDVNREFDEMGANYNAYTSHERTAYFAQVLPEFLPRAIDLLADMLRPALRRDDFDMEKQVILEEIGMYEDRPEWRLHDTLLEHHFADHPLSFRVLGTVDSIKALQDGQLKAYFEKRYSPDNITVAAAGRIAFEKLLEQVSAVTAAWQPTKAHRRYDKPRITASDHRVVDPKLSRHYMAMLLPGPNAQAETRYAAKILADLLGDDEGSRLYWALVDPGLADEADFTFYPQDRIGSFMAYASCDPDKAEQVEQILLKTIESVLDHVKADETERAKNKLATAVTLAEENPNGRMHGLGAQWLYLRRYTSLAEELQRLRAVTIDDLSNLIADTEFHRRTIVRLGPK